MKYKIFVISLKSNNRERRQNVKLQLAKLSEPFEFIDAVNGYEINKDHDERVAPEGRWVRPGHIGCSLSHLECYRRIVDEKLDFGVILEDDLLIKEDFTKGIEKIFQVMNGNKAVSFLYVRTFPKERLILSNNDSATIGQTEHKLYPLIGGRPNCTTAYIINRKASCELLREQFPVKTVADDFESFTKQGLIEKYFVLYPLTVGISPLQSQITNRPYGLIQKALFYLGKFYFMPDLLTLYKTRSVNRANHIFIFK